MFILRILSQQDILILNRAYSSASVGPDLCARHVQCEDEEGQGYFCLQVQAAQVGVQGSYKGEHYQEELEKSHRHDHKIDRSGVNFFVDFASSINKSKIVAVNEMFEDEVEAAKWSDERARDGEHDHHGEDQHHPCILLTKSKFIDDSFSNCRRICFTS